MAIREPDSLLSVKQLGDINLKRGGNSFEHEHRGIANTALNTADISAIKSAVGREILLADVALFAQAPEIPANAFSDVHRRLDQTVRLISPRLISLIFAGLGCSLRALLGHRTQQW